MKCPQCAAQMPAEGFCPSCGHLVLDRPDDEPDRAAVSRGAVEEDKHAAQQAPGEDHDAAVDTSSAVMTTSRDYSALLLGVSIYSVLLHPSLACLVLVVQNYNRASALMLGAVWIPVSYIITRLMCRIEPSTGRWTIRHAGLRRLFRRLNSIWFGP